MIGFDSSIIRQAERTISNVAQAVNDAQFRAVNQTARKGRTAASRLIRDQVRLKAGYVNDNLKITKLATRNDPEAILSGRRRPTRLARYGAKQLTRKASDAKGDSRRGIAPGRKQAGISVAVKRGGIRKKMRGAFMIPLKNGNGMGVFVRTGKGRKEIKQLYGPSINQMLKTIFPRILPETQQELDRQYRRQLSYELERRMK